MSPEHHDRVSLENNTGALCIKKEAEAVTPQDTTTVVSVEIVESKLRDTLALK